MKTLNELGLISATGHLEANRFIDSESQLAVELHGFYTVAELEAAIADLKAINAAKALQKPFFRVIGHYEDYSTIEGEFKTWGEAVSYVETLANADFSNYCFSTVEQVAANNQIIDRVRFEN